MNRLAVLILTKNEEKNIVDCIKNAQQVADEVVVIDSSSTDNTVYLAKQCGAKVAFRAWDDDFSAQRNFALTQTQAEWVLYLDADERLTDALVNKIQDIKNGPVDHGYSIKRVNIAFGHEYHYGAFGPDRVTRLFPRTCVRYVGKVHEHPECSVPIIDLPETMQHYTYDSYASWWNKAGHYTTIWAKEAADSGKEASAGKAAGHALLGMFKVYILQGGILEGSMGVIATLQHGMYTAIKYMKLAEYKKNGGE